MPTIVMTTPTAPTPKDRFTVHVIQGTLETASIVQVIYSFYLKERNVDTLLKNKLNYSKITSRKISSSIEQTLARQLEKSLNKLPPIKINEVSIS